MNFALKENIDTSSEKFTKIIPENLAQAKKLYEEGKVLFQQKDYKNAISKFFEAEGLTYKNYFCRVIVIKSLDNTSSEKTEDFLCESLNLAPNNHRYIITYAGFLAKNNKVEQAVEYYKKAITLCPNSEKYILEFARLCVKHDLKDGAEQNFTRLLELHPNNEIYLSDYAAFLHKTSQAQKSASYYIKLMNLYPNIDKYQSMAAKVAQLCIKNNFFDDANKLYKILLESSPNNEQYLAGYARLLAKTKQIEQAVKIYQKLIEVNPQSAQYLAEYAALLNDTGNTKEAIEYYKQSANLNDKNYRVLANLGNMLAKDGDAKEAEQYFLKSSICAEDKKTYITGLASALTQQLRFTEALPLYLEAIQHFPNDYNLYLRLADVYTGLKQHLKAAEALEKYLEKNPNETSVARRKIIHEQRVGIFSKEINEIKTFAIHKYNDGKPELTAVQKRVAEEALDTGIALTSIEELFDDKQQEMVNAALNQVIEFRQSEVAKNLIDKIESCDNFAEDLYFRGIFKPSVVNYMNTARTIKATDPMVQLYLSKQILDIANYYNGMLSKLRNVNLWINPRIKGKNIGTRKGSQIWHRDQEDEKILKCFIYLTDVDAESGALDYVPYSKCIPDRKFSDTHPYPFSSGYPGNYIFNEHIKQDTFTASCKKGTIAFADTNGFHRGGYVTKSERIVLMATYLRPISPYVYSNTRLDINGVDLKQYDEKIEYAIT